MGLNDGAVIFAIVRGTIAIGHRNMLSAQVDAAEIDAAPRENYVGMHCEVSPKTVWRMDESGDLVKGEWAARELLGIPEIRGDKAGRGAMCVYARLGDTRFVFEFPHDNEAPPRAFRSDNAAHCQDLSTVEMPSPVIREDHGPGEVEWASYLTRLLGARLNKNMLFLPDPKALKRELFLTIIPPMTQSGLLDWVIPETSDDRIGWLDPISDNARSVQAGPPSALQMLDHVPAQSARLVVPSEKRPGPSRT